MSINRETRKGDQLPKPPQTIAEQRAAKIKKCKVCRGTGFIKYEGGRIRCVACL